MRRRILLISVAGAIAVHVVVLGAVLPGLDKVVRATLGSSDAGSVGANSGPTTRRVVSVPVDWGGRLSAGEEVEIPDWSVHPIDDWSRLDLDRQFPPDAWPSLRERTGGGSSGAGGGSIAYPGFSVPPLPPPVRRDITDTP